ncbi:MAG: hypothetical protein F6K35_38935, partial [Okeania sp. SIO2H7]|nr:hypothetical protein [Okeania sp. SIO2H7]
VLPPQHLPRLILFADGVRAFNSGRQDRTYEIIASSEGYLAAIEGELQGAVSEAEDFKEEKEGENLFGNYEEIEGFLIAKMEEYLVSYRERDRLKNSLVSLIKINEDFGNGLCNGCNGWTDEVGDGQGEVNNGFLPISVKFEPAIYYQNHSKVSGEYDADYKNFKLSGQQAIAFENLLHFTQARRVKVVFVNMPLTKKYLDAPRMRYELKFREYMQQMDLEYPGLSFLDLSLSWPQAYENFSDPSHLNRYGAVAVAEALAEEQSIPWPQLDFRF